MMNKTLVFGSLNYDYVYHLDHIVAPGETQASSEMEVFFGGKGFNQSVALSKAGVSVYHAGLVGEEDGDAFIRECEKFGIEIAYIKKAEGKTGHAIIQLDKDAENSILLYGGSNRKITAYHVAAVLENFEAEDVIVLQNEISCLKEIMMMAHQIGMKIVFNPSPFEEKLRDYPLNLVSCFMINETEGFQITGEKEPQKILDRMQELYPEAETVLTVGKDGAFYAKGKERLYQPAFPVKAIDTTAAGDTFTGYYVSALQRGMKVKTALEIAAKAASIAVSRMGASASVPKWDEVIL